jgi:hypothetical protein
MRNLKVWMSLVLFVITTLLAGCGGGGSASGTAGGTGNTTPTSQLVTGVAATGSPLTGTVYLKDSSSPTKELSTQINADGSFSFNVTGLTAPFILKAVGSANGQNYTLCSFTSAPGVANINPLSNLAVVQANGGGDAATLYSAPTPAQLQAVKNAITTAISQIHALLQQVFTPYGVQSTNFISDPYSANHLGLDLLFDMVAIQVNNGSLTVTNKMAGSTILTATLNGTSLTGQVTTTNIPTVPALSAGTVFVYPASSSITVGGSAKFMALVEGSMNQSVTWSVVESGGGTITGAGLYTPPTTPGTYHIKATSVANTSLSGTGAVTVTAASNTTGTGTINLAGWSGTLTGITGNTLDSTSEKITVLDWTYVNASYTTPYYYGHISGDKGLIADLIINVNGTYWDANIMQDPSWGTYVAPSTGNFLFTTVNIMSVVQQIPTTNSLDLTFDDVLPLSSTGKNYELKLTKP